MPRRWWITSEGLRVLNRLELPGKVRRAVEEFVKRVREVLGEVEVYLFGSYARGDWIEDSDLDLVVVSPYFKGLTIGERYVIVRELLPKDVGVEMLLYTPEEFERVKKRSVVIQDAMEYWVRLL